MSWYTTRDVVLYIVKMLRRVEGLKKLVKLMFLMQYSVKTPPLIRPLIRRRYVVKYLYRGEPITRTEFYIWRYGPFSNDIYKVIDECEELGLIEITEDELGRTVIVPGQKLKDREVELPDEVAKRISAILREYGGKSGTELELYVLEKLLFMKRPEYKEDWYGVYVDDYYKHMGVKLGQVDLYEPE